MTKAVETASRIPEMAGPSSGYILENYTDRDRLYMQFALNREQMSETIARALKLGGKSTDPATADWRALDIGCGEGLYSADLIEHYPRIQAVGLDRDLEAISTANGAFAGKGDLHFVTGDISQPLPAELAPGVPGTGFDLAMMLFCLVHIREADRALANVHAALKPGGMLLVYDPMTIALTHPHPAAAPLMDAINRGVATYGNLGGGDRHREQLGKAGFEVLESAPHESPVGGTTDVGQSYHTVMVLLLRSLRRALVDITRVIPGAEYDSLLERFASEPTPADVGAWRMMRTIARKPV